MTFNKYFAGSKGNYSNHTHYLRMMPISTLGKIKMTNFESSSRHFLINDHHPGLITAAEQISDRQIMELRILLSHTVVEKEIYKFTARLKKLEQIKNQWSN